MFVFTSSMLVLSWALTVTYGHRLLVDNFLLFTSSKQNKLKLQESRKSPHMIADI